MKTINWNAVRASTPPATTCPWCERENIVVNRTNGLRAKHYTERKKRSGQKRVWCEGGDKLYTSTPGGTT